MSVDNHQSQIDPPDWNLWAAKTFWSIEEAAALINGVDPTKTDTLSPHALDVLAIMKGALARAKEIDSLPNPARPIHYVDLLETISEQGVHPLLRKAVRDYNDDPVRSFDRLARRCRDLERENDELKSKASVDPRKRRTLSEVMLALAMKHYGFHPERKNKATASIVQVLAEYGYQRSADAIHRNLVEAYEQFTPSKLG